MLGNKDYVLATPFKFNGDVGREKLTTERDNIIETVRIKVAKRGFIEHRINLNGLLFLRQRGLRHCSSRAHLRRRHGG